MTLHEMLERRAAIVAEMRGIADKPNGSAGDLSQEQEQRFETLKGELTSLEQRIGRQQLVDEAERCMAGTPVGGTSDTGSTPSCGISRWCAPS